MCSSVVSVCVCACVVSACVRVCVCVYAYDYVVCMRVFLFTATMVLYGISRLRRNYILYLMILQKVYLVCICVDASVCKHAILSQQS